MKKKLTHSYVGWLFALLSFCSVHLAVGDSDSSLCVARLRVGDEFVNKGGVISSCAKYGASCAEEETNNFIEEGGVENPELCDCNPNVGVDTDLPCPVCKCNSAYPLFNGTNCKSEMPSHLNG